MVWEGKDVVKTGRKMLGATNPLESDPGTIRGDFAIDVGRYALCSTTYNAIFYIHIHIYIYILNSTSMVYPYTLYFILIETFAMEVIAWRALRERLGCGSDQREYNPTTAILTTGSTNKLHVLIYFS